MGCFVLPEEDLELDYTEFRQTFKRVRKQIYQLKKEDKANYATHLKGKTDLVIRHGLENVGTFHIKRPFADEQKG